MNFFWSTVLLTNIFRIFWAILEKVKKNNKYEFVNKWYVQTLNSIHDEIETQETNMCGNIAQ